MKGNNYTVKEIILGLREEYLNIYKKLDELKCLCDADYKRIKDFNFLISLTNGLYCEVIENKDINCDLDKKHVDCIQNNDGNYSLQTEYFNGFNFEVFPVSVSADKQSIFSEKVSEILTTSFIQNIEHDALLTVDEGLNTVFVIKPRDITMCIDPLSIDNNPGVVSYDPRLDVINVESFDCYLSHDFIEKLMNVSISNQELKTYHIKTINTSGILNKKIILDRVESCQDVTLSIQENAERVVLTKVMK